MVWFLVGLAVFFGLIYQDKIDKEAAAKKADSASDLTSEASEANKKTKTSTSPVSTPADASEAKHSLTPPPSQPLKNGQVLSSANGLSKLLLLSDKEGLKCTINNSTGQSQAQFQLVEIQALHTSPPAHEATLPADLGMIRLFLVKEIKELTHANGSQELRIQGLNLNTDGQTESLIYRLNDDELSLLSPETASALPESTSQRNYSPALYFLKQH